VTSLSSVSFFSPLTAEDAEDAEENQIHKIARKVEGKEKANIIEQLLTPKFLSK